MDSSQFAELPRRRATDEGDLLSLPMGNIVNRLGPRDLTRLALTDKAMSTNVDLKSALSTALTNAPGHVNALAAQTEHWRAHGLAPGELQGQVSSALAHIEAIPDRLATLFSNMLAALIAAGTPAGQPQARGERARAGLIEERMRAVITHVLPPGMQVPLLAAARQAVAAPTVPGRARDGVINLIWRQATKLPPAHRAAVLRDLLSAVGRVSVPPTEKQLGMLKVLARAAGRLPEGGQYARLRAEIAVASNADAGVLDRLDLQRHGVELFAEMRAMHAERQPPEQFPVLSTMPRLLRFLPTADRVPALADIAMRSTNLGAPQRMTVLARLVQERNELALPHEEVQPHIVRACGGLTPEQRSAVSQGLDGSDTRAGPFVDPTFALAAGLLEILPRVDGSGPSRPPRP